jgi:hypothetical protein
MLIQKHIKLTSLPDFFNAELETLSETLHAPFEQKFFEEFSQSFKEQFISYVEHTLNVKNLQISEGWLNCIKYAGSSNAFDWHNEDGVGVNDGKNEGAYVCIMWVRGSYDKGGSFKYINDDGNIINVPLDLPSLMVIKKDTMHSVEDYTGTEYRMSFNFNFDAEII